MCVATYFLVCIESDPGDTDANIKDSVVLSV